VILSLRDAVLIQPFVPDGAVPTLDLGVLLRLTGLDMLDGNPMHLNPFHPFPGRVIRSTILKERFSLMYPGP